MEIHLRLPGSTSNLGSGFDALGLALTIYNRLTVRTTSGSGIRISIQGAGAGVLPENGDNLFFKMATLTAGRLGKSLPGLDVVMHNEIPLARGLGSSSTAVVAGIVVANLLADAPLSKAEVLNLATDLEGHPDNVSPCLQGGLTISSVDGGRVECIRALPPVELRAVAVVPQFELQTEAARAALPVQVPHKDAIFNLSRACLVTGALLGGHLHALKVGMQDRLHQPYRSHLIPGFNRVLEAAVSAGALGAALSGAGPTLVAFATKNAEAVGQAMVVAWQAEHIASTAFILEIDPDGVVVE